jgi:arginine utilization regulatory protein
MKNFSFNNTYITRDNLIDIFNTMDEGIMIVDENLKIIFYNKKASEIDSFRFEEVVGQNLFDVYQSLTQETSTLVHTLNTGEKITNVQQTYINKKGKKVTTINSTIPIHFNNNKIGAMEVFKDITQIKELVNSLNYLRDKLKNKSTEIKSKKICSNNTDYYFKDIIGESIIIKSVLENAMKAAGTNSSVLIYGETGTGKELFAQSIHNASDRRNYPFIAQNCAALPKDILEGLIFGTEKGGFTGATSRPGLFEQANGGTILLDELNAMNPNLQAKLLRVLQENKVRRLGGEKEIDVDVRIIATINENPEEAINNKRLREDLYYRLSVVFLEIPPLRERREDIPILIDFFINYFNQKISKSIKTMDEKLNKLFINYYWPGNVRELKNIIEGLYNLINNNEEIISYRYLPGYIKDRLKKINPYYDKEVLDVNLGENYFPLKSTIERIELTAIKKYMKKENGNITAAAERLGISRQLLDYKMQKYGIKNA